MISVVGFQWPDKLHRLGYRYDGGLREIGYRNLDGLFTEELSCLCTVFPMIVLVL